MNRIGDRGSHAHKRDLAHALHAKRVHMRIVLVDEDDLELAHVRIHWHEVFGDVAVRRGKQGLAKRGKPVADQGMIGDRRHGRQRAETQAPVRAGRDTVVETGEAGREIHETGRPTHVLLEELVHIRTAGDVLGVGGSDRACAGLDAFSAPMLNRRHLLSIMLLRGWSAGRRRRDQFIRTERGLRRDPGPLPGLKGPCKVGAELGPYLERVSVVRKAVLSEIEALEATRPR